eukprot:TRINITY_DN2701_c0_g2_i1.p1 TRINITY_DN2701_c0_g2~~TRINITY_DN2701_c0_g2_i1.p1  ORF type:complete len:1060 (+),score=208.59 TRINITY_DN2701_c0_g2_i1:103-3282(+)
MKVVWLGWLSNPCTRWSIYFLFFLLFWTILRSLSGGESHQSVVGFNSMFPQLEEHVTQLQLQNEPTSKRIFIVTTEFDGLVRGGGISTAFTALALKMSQSGHKVTVMFVGKIKYGDESQWKSFYNEKQIRLIFVSLSKAQQYNGCSGPCIRSFTVYNALLQYEYEIDVIHFQDHTAVGHFTIQSKHQGQHFTASTIILGAHGPFLWERTANQFYLDDTQHIELDLLERKCAQFADYVISPSNYMLNWMLGLNWKISPHSFVQQNLLPWTNSLQSTEENTKGETKESQKVVVNELVFFGRLEVRKGLITFCDALKFIPRSNMPLITFMGKETILPGNVPVTSFIQSECGLLNITCQILTTLSHSQALDYLTQRNRLVIIASTIDNSPNTVLECLTHRIPFLASDVGGISELVHSDDRAHVLFPPHPYNLAEKINEALKNGAFIAKLFQDEYTRHKIWSDFHSLLPPSRNPDSFTPKHERPKLSIVFSFPNTIENLELVLTPIKNQDYPPESIELIVYLSALQKSLEGKVEKSLQRWKHSIFIHHESNFGFVHMWNQLASLSGNSALLHGEWIVFFDFLNAFYKPSSLSTVFRTLSKTQAEIFSGPSFKEEKQTFTIYPACELGLGVMKNCFGSNLVVKKDLLYVLKSLQPDADLWEFYMRSHLRNISIEVSVEPLFSDFRVESSSLSSFPNYTQGIKMAKEIGLPITMETSLIIASHFSQTKDTLWKSIQTQQKSAYDLEKKINTETNQLKMDMSTCQNQKNTILGIDPLNPQDVFKESAQMRLFLARAYEETGLDVLMEFLNKNMNIFASDKSLNFADLGQALQIFTSAKWVLGKSDPYQTLIHAEMIKYIQHVLSNLISEPTKKAKIEWIGHISNSTLSPLLPNTPYIFITRDGRHILVDIFLNYVKFGSHAHLCSAPLVSPDLVNKYREDSEYFDKNPTMLFSNEECFRQVSRNWAQHMKNDLEMESIIKNEIPPSRNNKVLRLEYITLFQTEFEEKISSFLNIKITTNLPHNTQRTPLANDYKKYFTQQYKRWFQFETGNTLRELGYLNDNDLNDW